MKKREKLKREKQKNDWIDFGEKIVYLYEKLFNRDKDKLIFYFSDQTLPPRKRKSRKKTIENWLKGETGKPNGFKLSKFKISEYKLQGEVLFPIYAFQSWSIKTFKERVELYLSEKQTLDIPNEMRYIYFFDSIEKKLAYFKISYPNADNDSMIHLHSELYTSDMTYKGEITTYNNMTYISVRNEFDLMHYIFKNNVSVYRKELKVFGVAQCVDAPTREPKSYLALLSSNMLSTDEERKLSHKLNFSNLMIADDFTHGCAVERDFFLENFSQKIYDLNRDINHYNIHEELSNDMYFDIVLKEYRAYIKLLEKSLYHNDYPIDHKRQSILFALEEMCRNKPSKATILYLLDSETMSILDSKNSIMEMQLKLVRKEKLSLTYLFIVQDLTLITQRSIEQIKYLQNNGIKVTLSTNAQSIYSKILVVEKKDFAIYKRKNEHSDNHVTKNATTIEALSYEVEELSKSSISLDNFIAQHYPLNGKWYHYTFSKNKAFQTVQLNIKNSSLQAIFPNKINEGSLLKMSEYTLLLMEHSVIKIQNINIHDHIFRVSIIGKEKNMYHRDVLLFGLMSREELTNEQVLLLLNSIHKKEEEKHWLKISNDFDSTLACFD
jgi:hypothetical protein